MESGKDVALTQSPMLCFDDSTYKHIEQARFFGVQYAIFLDESRSKRAC